MKAFNLEEALAGKPVVTRGGSKVLRIVEFGVPSYPLAVTVEGTNRVKSYTSSGRYYDDASSSIWDMFMETTKRQGFINVYPVEPGLTGGSFSGDGKIKTGLSIFDTRKQADDNSTFARLAVATFEYEEYEE